MEGLSFEIRDAAGVFETNVVAHGGAAADLCWNDISRAWFVLDDDNPALALARKPGAKAIVRLNGVEEFRGRIGSTPGVGPVGQATVNVEGDMRKLWQWLGWPNPSSAISAQTSEYDRRTGPVETVVKNALAANFARLGVPWVVAPSLGRGPTVTADLRMDYLADVLMPHVRAQRWSLEVTYPGDVPTVDIRLPETVAGVLDPSSGRLDQFNITPVAPSATRVVIGGEGAKDTRRFDLLIDTARESAWDDIIEVFADAPSVKDGEDLKPAGQAVLDEGAPGARLAMEITEQPGFAYRSTYRLGDLVNATVAGVTATEVISRVSVADNDRDGVTVTPSVGEIVEDDEIERLGKQLARLDRRARKQARR